MLLSTAPIVPPNCRHDNYNKYSSIRYTLDNRSVTNNE